VHRLLITLPRPPTRFLSTRPASHRRVDGRFHFTGPERRLRSAVCDNGEKVSTFQRKATSRAFSPRLDPIHQQFIAVVKKGRLKETPRDRAFLLERPAGGGTWSGNFIISTIVVGETITHAVTITYERSGRVWCWRGCAIAGPSKPTLRPLNS
jgi:hypothetical protein